MAATAPPLRPVGRVTPPFERAAGKSGARLVSPLTILALVIHGYHPYAEDGGLYLAGVKSVLHPELYPYFRGFTTAHLRFSLFAPMVAGLVRASHLSLMGMMLFLYVASIWATLLAAWQIAIRCFRSREACVGAVTLLALLLTVPVAGTSLMLMDPYVSARSISTPCSLFALVAVTDIGRQIRQEERISIRSLLLCCGSLLLAALVHPLMAADALGCALVLAAAGLMNGKWQWVAYAGVCVTGLAAAALLIRFALPCPPGYMEIARTRSYWFLSSWHWYELLGLAAPLLVLAAIRFRLPNIHSGAFKWIAQMAIFVGCLSVLVAVTFARVDMSTYAVARLQPLRVFQTVYVITIVSVGAAVGEFVLRRSTWRRVAMIAGVGITMLFVQIGAFANSAHFEFPWAAPANDWERAFTWIRNNTPEDALIALDADYINAPGEDSHNFRAIAERSAVPDYSKDGGIASIASDLTADWFAGEKVQKGLDRATDAERIHAPRAFRVDWVVLSSGAITGFACDYANHAAKVCRVPARVRP